MLRETSQWRPRLLIRLNPPTAPRRTQALAALCDQLTSTLTCYLSALTWYPTARMPDRIDMR